MQSDDLPTQADNEVYDALAGWRHIEDDGLRFLERAAWVHEKTGLRVAVRRQRIPSQMHDPATASDDAGFVATVQDDGGRAKLSHELGSKPAAYEAAVRFMLEYSDGEFQVPEPGEVLVDDGPLDWRDDRGAG